MLDVTAKKKVPFVFQRDASDGMMQSDLCGLLGVTEEASPAEIKKAGLRFLLIWHPDKCGETKPRLRYDWIQAAFKILTDAEGRRFWNERIAREKAKEEAERARIARLRARLEARRGELRQVLAQKAKRARERESTPAEPAPEPASPEGGVAAEPTGTPPQPLPKRRPRGSVRGNMPERWTRPKHSAPVLSKEQREEAKQKIVSGQAAGAEPEGSPPQPMPESASPSGGSAPAGASSAPSPEPVPGGSAPAAEASSAPSSGPVPGSAPPLGATRKFRSTSELFRVCHLRYLQREALKKQQQQEQAMRKQRAEQSESVASSSGAAAPSAATASPDQVHPGGSAGPSSEPTRVSWPASRESVWGSSEPSVDVAEPVAESFAKLTKFDEFVAFCQHLHPGSSVCDTVGFLNLV